MLKLNVDPRGLIHLGKMSGGYFITTIINQALPFLILPILTRYLNPEEYGNIALFNFYFLLSNAIVGVSVHAVISKHFFERPKEYTAKIIGNSIFLVGILSLILVVVVLLAYPFFNLIFNLPLKWLILIPVTSFCFIIFNISLLIMRNKREIVTFTKFQVGNTLINISISLVLIIFLLWGWQGRILGIILAFFISSVISFSYLKRNGYVCFKISRKIKNYILSIIIPLIPNSMQAVIVSQVGFFFIQFYFSKELLGLYSIAFQICMAIRLLVVTINMSWTPHFYEQFSKINQLNKVYLTRMFLTLTLILIIGVIFINIMSEYILKVMTTPEFYKSREFIKWITLGFLFEGMNIFLFPIFINNSKQAFVSMISLFSILLIILLSICFIRLFGYIGVAYAFLITHIIRFLIFFIKANKLFKLPWIKAIKLWE